MKYKTLTLIFLIFLTGNLFAQKETIVVKDILLGSANSELTKNNVVPANPEDFSIRYTCTFIKLTWLPNENDDPVVIAYNSENRFGTLVNGKEYKEDDILPGGGTIVYIGSCKHFRHFNPPSDKCYYKIWSFDNKFNYSIGVQAVCIDESLINAVIKFITD